MIDFTTVPTQVNKKLVSLQKGDVVKTLNGIYAFDRIPKGGKSWYGKSMTDGRSYRIRIMNFNQDFKIIGHYSFIPEVKNFIKSSSNDVKSLMVGDLFVIKHGKSENAELFRYVRETQKNVVAVNPITNKTFNISKSFTFTKISNLVY